MSPQIIGEVGLSHEGSLGVAIGLVEALARVGVKAVKFQMHIPEAESTLNEPFRNPVFKQDKSRYEYWKRTAFSQEEWYFLKEACLENDVEFICTPFSVQAIERLLALNVKTIKLGSGDFTNEEMLDRLQDFPGKLILSTGMANEEEIFWVTRRLAGRPPGQTVLMHCTSMYPTPADCINLGYMDTLREISGFEVGYSDHSGEVAVSLAALTLGASYLEAHAVFDKRQFGVDTASSLTIDEFELLSGFASRRDLIVSLGDKNKIAERLETTRQTFGRSLCLKSSKPSGHLLQEEDFTMKKPGGGLSWPERARLVGVKLKADVDSNDHLALKFLREKDF